MNKCFVLLGGNILNKGVYQKLNKAGSFVIVVDWNEQPAIVGQKHLQLDVKDYDSIIPALVEAGVTKENFSGCYTSIDAAVTSVRHIFEGFGYIYGGPNLERATDKAVMTDIWRKHGLCTRKSIMLDHSDVEKVDFNGLSKVIIKPNKSSSSRGISIVNVDNLERVRQNVKVAKGESFDGKVLIEEFVEGTEFTIEMLSDSDKNIDVFAISKKYHTKHLTDNKVAIKLHYNPSDVERDVLFDIADFARKCFRALDIVSCFGHMEIIRDTNGNFHPLEIGARSSGYIASDLVELASGTDYFSTFLQIIQGAKLTNKYWDSDFSSMYFFYDVKPNAVLQNKMNLLDFLPDTITSKYSNRENLQKGFVVPQINNDNERVGYEILHGPKEDMDIKVILEAEANMLGKNVSYE